MHTRREVPIIRCDDVFVDSDATQFEKICKIIRRYGFDHLVGITPLGEGKKLWAQKGIVWRIQLARCGLFINSRILKMTGEKCIGNNAKLLKVLNAEFSSGAIPALHGLHHYRYDVMDQGRVYHELSTGVKLLRKLFNVDVKVFTAPFNAWDYKTVVVCKNLNLSIDECFAPHIIDESLRNMNSYQIEQLAKKQSPSLEVLYHPYQMLNLEKFELYLKTRRKYC
jgi:peptidoglycan/xylan/chitin deacetylase (PgdA/CDA1 family)